MELRYGKNFENKTSKYLYPALLEGLGKVFRLKIEKVSVMACGLDDYSLKDNPKYQPLQEKRAFFILIDTFFNKRVCEDFIHWLKYQPFFLASYHIDLISRGLMVVLEFPKQFEEAFDNFALGKYSEMYTEEDLKLLFSENSEEYKVLTKCKQLIPDFSKRLQELLDLDNFEGIDLHNIELEFPINIELKQEIFNA